MTVLSVPFIVLAMLTQQLSGGVLASSALIFLKNFYEGQMQHGITHDLGKEGQLNKQ